MKRFHKKVVLWSILVIIAAVLFSGLCLFWPVIRSAASVRYLEDGLYSMEYSGDYGLDGFMEQGGGASDMAVAALLVFFASMVGRMDAWLGPDGKGMMDAFNTADHDLGVQMLGMLDEAEAEELVLSYTGIIDSYVLAMPSVAVNGVDYTAKRH